MIRQILTEPDERLHQPAEPVTVFDTALQTLVSDMRETMHQARGIGLAAPQVGELKQVLIVEYAPESKADEVDTIPFTALVNPRVTWTSPDKVEMWEGCLSIPGMEGAVIRPRKVRIKGYTPTGEKIQIKASGLFGRVLQHEIDHLHGQLYSQILVPGSKLRPVKSDKPTDHE